MPKVVPEVTTDVLQQFADAFNRHDIDALMSFMTEDCVLKPLQAQTSAAPDTQAVTCSIRLRGSVGNVP